MPEIADPGRGPSSAPAAARPRAPGRWPPWGRSRPASTRSKVVLPAPLAPSTARVAPLRELHADPGERHPLAVAALDPVELDRGGSLALSRLRGVAGGVGSTTGHDWPIAFGLPGKFTISVPPAHSRDPPGEDAERRVPAGVGPDRLRVARRLAVDHVAGRLGRDVVGREPGPARGEDEADVSNSSASCLRTLAISSPVIGYRHPRDVEARPLAQLGQRGPGHVLALPRERGRGDGDHCSAHERAA